MLPATVGGRPRGAGRSRVRSASSSRTREVAERGAARSRPPGLEHLRLGRDDELDGGTADHEDGAHRLHLVPATVAKGLEFDRVVVVEPAAIAAAEPDERTGLRRLYVVLTRAVTGLAVVHAEPLPAALRS